MPISCRYRTSGRIAVRTFERGVEDETLSCGTGVTACAYIHLLSQGLAAGIVGIDTPGGKLEVEVQARGTSEEKVFLTGPAKHVFSGVYLTT
jgi:diaminopimelate epimerase